MTVASLGVAALVLAGCGGDDDSAASSTTTLPAEEPDTITLPPTTTSPPTTTTPPTTTVEYVTQGATVVVANASRIDGAAGRLTERLANVGFTTTDATNGSDAAGDLEVSQIFYVPDDDAALAVANSLREAFGGGDIEVREVAVPAPTESGELGDATVLVMMGNDIADKTLEELQGVTATADTGDEATTDGTTPATTGDEAED